MAALVLHHQLLVGNIRLHPFQDPEWLFPSQCLWATLNADLGWIPLDLVILISGAQATNKELTHSMLSHVQENGIEKEYTTPESLDQTVLTNDNQKFVINSHA
jgi:hypothetical protein